MAKAKGIRVKETPQQLKQLLKQQSKAGLRNRIIMLQQIQKSKTALSKNELAELAGVNHNSIQKWRRLYETGGMSALLEHKQGGKRRAVITAVGIQPLKKS